jgi:hypothetical protein
MRDERRLRAELPVYVGSFNQPSYVRQMVETLLCERLRQRRRSPTMPRPRQRRARFWPSYEALAGVRVWHLGENIGPSKTVQRIRARERRGLRFHRPRPRAFADAPGRLPRNSSSRYRGATGRERLTSPLKSPAADEARDLRFSHPDFGDFTVQEWERRFWEDELEPGIYRANVDTTFFLWNPAPSAFDLRRDYARLRALIRPRRLRVGGSPTSATSTFASPARASSRAISRGTRTTAFPMTNAPSTRRRQRGPPPGSAKAADAPEKELAASPQAAGWNAPMTVCPFLQGSEEVVARPEARTARHDRGRPAPGAASGTGSPAWLVPGDEAHQPVGLVEQEPDVPVRRPRPRLSFRIRIAVGVKSNVTPPFDPGNRAASVMRRNSPSLPPSALFGRQVMLTWCLWRRVPGDKRTRQLLARAVALPGLVGIGDRHPLPRRHVGRPRLVRPRGADADDDRAEVPARPLVTRYEPRDRRVPQGQELRPGKGGPVHHPHHVVLDRVGVPGLRVDWLVRGRKRANRASRSGWCCCRSRPVLRTPTASRCWSNPTAISEPGWFE